MLGWYGLKHLQVYQSCLSYISDIISDETSDEIIVSGNKNCDPDKGWYFNELRRMATLHSLHWTDIEKLPPFSYIYVSHNTTASTSWIDHTLCSTSNLGSNLEILYGKSCQDHIPINWELTINHPAGFTLNELTHTGKLKQVCFGTWSQTNEFTYIAIASKLFQITYGTMVHLVFLLNVRVISVMYNLKISIILLKIG